MSIHDTTVTSTTEGGRCEVRTIGTIPERFAPNGGGPITVEYQHLSNRDDHWHTVYATSDGGDLAELDARAAIRLGAMLIDAGLVALAGEQATA